MVVAGLMIGAALAATAAAGHPSLEGRMAALAAEREKCRRAAELVVQERWSEARDLLGDRAPSPPPSPRERMAPGRREAGSARWISSAGHRPDLAVRLFEEAMAKGYELTFDEERQLAELLIQLGRYDEARSRLSRLARGRDWLCSDLERVDALAFRTLSPLDTIVKRHSGNTTFASPPTNVLLELWAYHPIAARARTERLFKIAELSRDAVTEQLAREAVVALPGAPPDAVAQALLALGQAARDAGELERAASYWKRASGPAAPAASRATALYGLGHIRREQGKDREAVGLFREILGLPVDDADPGCNIMASYANYRPEAQWALAETLLRAGKAEEALEEFRTAQRRYRFVSFCGNCQASMQLRYVIYEGVCLEHLERFAEAVPLYLSTLDHDGLAAAPPALVDHVAEMYAASGQLDDLERLLRGDSAEPPSPAITLRRLEAAASWDALIARLEDLGGDERPEHDLDRRDRYFAHTAAALLARHAAETVPRLVARTQPGHDSRWVVYTLGRASTPEALARLREIGRGADTLAYTALVALSFSAEGRAVLDELVESGVRDAAAVREERAHARRASDGEIPFPPVRGGQRLPTERPALRALEY